MQVTSGIQCNLLSPSYSTIYAPQGDAKSRFVLIQLLEGAAPWEVPAGASVIIRAAKPDGTFCFYDTNETGESAYTISGSTVTIELVGQVLAAPGPVLMQIDFYNADGAHLSTFSFRCQVSESVVADDDIVSSNYFSVLTATLTEMLQIEQAVKAAYGAPLVAATAAAMTDHTRVYVYTGSEAGYTNGNWYYWNGSAWASGGVYNSSAVNVDSAPTQGSTNPVSSGGTYSAIAAETAARTAADTALGDELNDVKSALDEQIIISETQPTSPNTKIWIDSTSDSVQVPTVGEINQLIDAIFPTRTLTDQPFASFGDGANGIPVKSLSVSINPIQSGSGDPSPDNVRPISGWTGANVTRTGKNLVSFPYSSGNVTVYGVTMEMGDNNVHIYGTPTRGISYIFMPRFKIHAGVTYTLSFSGAFPTTAGEWRIQVYSAETTIIYKRISMATPVGSFTPQNDDVVSVYITTDSGVINIPVDFTIAPQLELGTVASPVFEPSKASEVSVTFPSDAGTVYGGTLDAINGVLTVDREIVDLGTLTWTYYTAGVNPVFYAPVSGHKVYTDGETVNVLTTIYPVGALARDRTALAAALPDKSCSWISGTYGSFIIRDSSYTSAAAFKAAMSSVVLCYELATPVTYQLTPQEVTTLLGQNNIWADTGNISLTYRVDLKSYIDEAAGGV